MALVCEGKVYPSHKLSELVPQETENNFPEEEKRDERIKPEIWKL